MSKKHSGIAWGKASKELKDKIKFILQQSQNNRYSVSRIYAAYNAIFELQEQPQTCATCLTSRVSKLRAWWHANQPEAVATTGEVQDATSYEGVLSKYGVKLGEGVDELGTLQMFIDAGAANSEVGAAGIPGITEGELALLKQRHADLTAALGAPSVEERVSGKLAALGITGDSTDEDALEAYEVLAAAEGNPEDEQAYYSRFAGLLKGRIKIAGLDNKAPDYTVLNMGEGVLGMHFTPSTEDAAKGTIVNADGSKPKPGTYTSADGKTIAVQVGGKATIK